MPNGPQDEAAKKQEFVVYSKNKALSTYDWDKVVAHNADDAMALSACAYVVDYIQHFKGLSDLLEIQICRQEGDKFQLYLANLYGQSELVEFSLDEPDLSDSLCTLGE